MPRAAPTLILILAVGSTWLVASARADGLRSYDRVVDLGEQKYFAYTYSPRLNEQGSTVEFKPDSGGPYQLERIDPQHNGHFTGWTLHKVGATTNLLPDSLNQPRNIIYGANVSGHIAGNLYVSKYTPFFFAPETGQTTLLKSLPGASNFASIYGLNARDEMVGNQNGKAIYFASPTSEPVELASLLPKNTGWQFFNASDINDRGEIIGYGINPAGKPADFKLVPTASPVPEPTTLAIFAVAGLCFVAHSRQRRI